MNNKNKTPTTAIYTAFGANVAIAIVKLTAAGITGSSAMASEGIHSLVDTSNEILLLLGIRKSQKKPDAKRPFGYAKEIYFWAFVVSLLFFALGGGMSIYEGIQHMRHPESMEKPIWNYAVLGFAFIFDGISLITAWKQFRVERGKTPFWRAVKDSKDPSTFVVLFEDAADVIGILIAFFGILLSQLLHNPLLDGIASVLIGLLLTSVAIILVRESRSLLMGESASAEELTEVTAIALSHPEVQQVAAPMTMYLGPQEVILILKIHFADGLDSQNLSTLIHDIREQVQQKYPQYKQLFIEPV
ncbi:cation diffusion facilitator family transporter [bacterium A37T11]|nr:cation diffusion facilitator family transporter [bacterium A37T11]